MSLPAVETLEAIDLSENPLETLMAFGNGVDYRLLRMGRRPVLLLNQPELIRWAFTSSSRRFVALEHRSQCPELFLRVDLI